MRARSLPLLASTVLAFVTATLLADTVPAQRSTPSGASATGWISLFDGTSLDAWRGYRQTDTAATRWAIGSDGTLCVDPASQSPRRPHDIVTKATFDQFELRWEWRVAQGGNSGLKYFVLEDQSSAIGHEYQMIDDERHPDAKRGASRQTAALYDVLGATNRPTKPAGEWNESRVVVSGMQVEHWLNGVKVLEYELASAPLKAAIAKSKFNEIGRFGTRQKAHILLQDHGEVACYRNITIRAATPTGS